VSPAAKVAGGNGPGFLTHRQLRLLLRGRDLGHVLFHEDDDDDDDDYRPRGYFRTRRPRPNRTLPKVPSEEGRELMNSGRFGSTETSSTIKQRKTIAHRLLDRELGISQQGKSQGLMAQTLIPTTDPDMIIRYDRSVFSGQFSDDGNFFFSVVQDFTVRMYDTSNPYNWRHYKSVDYPFGSWTLTDASLSPDNKWLAYTSITPRVCLAPTDPNDTGDPYSLDLSGSEQAARAGGWRHGGHSFGIFSIRFSGDGRELVAGTNAHSIVVFDIESRQVLHKIAGHDNDVNAVCFADKDSPHILYSGSDDATLKVWDRRSMGDRREAGAFVGHCEGLTYIDSKGDGRYIISNGKDQCGKVPFHLLLTHSTDANVQSNSGIYAWQCPPRTSRIKIQCNTLWEAILTTDGTDIQTICGSVTQTITLS
jgi:DDB1- and CUL4-associated factor 11